MSAISVTYTREGDVHTLDTGPGALGSIVVDNSGLSPDQKGGTAKQLLAASALYCYCSALVSALDARGVRYTGVTGRADVILGSNTAGQGRVTGIDITVNVTLPEEDEDIFERCAKILKQGCLVTGSLHEGIHMNYRLDAEYEE